MTDPVSRLLEAIAETERLAEAAGRDGEPNWTAGGDLSETVSTVKYGSPVAAGPYGYLVPEIRAHIAHNDPASVRRRCAADKVIAETTRMAQEHYREVLAETEGDPGSSARVADAWRQATTWGKAARLVAEGYGLSDHRQGDNG